MVGLGPFDKIVNCEFFKPDIMDELVLVMVDFKKAFPSVVRECVYMILERVGVPEADLELLKHLHETCEFFITLDGLESERWLSTRGFKEGGASSPTLFNVLSEVGAESTQRGAEYPLRTQSPPERKRS